MTRFDEVRFDQALFDRAFYILKQSSDSGSGVEALFSRIFGAGETGSGIEVLLFRLVSQDDSGLGVDDIIGISKLLTAVEVGRGIERLIAKIELASNEGVIKLPPASGAMAIPGRQVGMPSKEVGI